jgi:hypothetical protein
MEENSVLESVETTDSVEIAAQPNKGKSRKKIVIISIVLAVVVIAVAAVCFWYFQYKVPYDQAVENYNEAASNYNSAITALETRNAELDENIALLQAVIDSEDPPLDDTLLVSSGAVVGEAQGVKSEVPEIPEIPEETDAINAAAAELITKTGETNRAGDYSEEISNLQDAKQLLETSIRQMEQVTNPTEQFVISRLQGIPNIVGLQAVTEDHDPNGKLNKQGGYTATVYFSSDLVDPSNYLDEGDIVDKGTDGGGGIEVYRTVEDAESRSTYLGAFDGSIFASGSHTVCGTVLIRISNYLTASQQQALEQSIREALIRID